MEFGLKNITYNPIGIIHTPFQCNYEMPIQSVGGKGIKGKINLFPEFQDGLNDLIGFSHLILIYHLHLSRGYKLKVKPFLDDNLRGVFATRAPHRPNPIGISIVRLKSIKDCRIQIEDIDIVDETPLLDIKPYIQGIDSRDKSKSGWSAGKLKEFQTSKSDKRFNNQKNAKEM